MRHLLWRIPVIAFLVLDPVRIALREVNLHCDQYTSLPIVLLEREPHAEEDAAALPPAYRSPWAVPIRIVFGLAFAAAMLGPAAAVWISSRRRRHAVRLLVGLTPFALVALPLLGHLLGGERARDLALWSFWGGTGWAWYAAAWAVVAWDRARTRARVAAGETSGDRL